LITAEKEAESSDVRAFVTKKANNAKKRIENVCRTYSRGEKVDNDRECVFSSQKSDNAKKRIENVSARFLREDGSQARHSGILPAISYKCPKL
jgi:hypothetical protein